MLELAYKAASKAVGSNASVGSMPTSGTSYVTKYLFVYFVSHPWRIAVRHIPWSNSITGSAADTLRESGFKSRLLLQAEREPP